MGCGGVSPCRIVALFGPEFCFSTIAIMDNVRTQAHTDKNLQPLVTCTFGKFAGGEYATQSATGDIRHESHTNRTYHSDDDEYDDDDDGDDDVADVSALRRAWGGLEGKESEEMLEFMEETATASSGMASALSLLRSTGDLGREKQPDVEGLVGRSRDTRDFRHQGTDLADVKSAGGVDVKLEYRDKDNNLLTRREAFRQLCYRFHGYTPGLKKRQKRLDAVEKGEQSGVDHTNVGSMKLHQQATERSGRAHVTLTGAKK